CLHHRPPGRGRAFSVHKGFVHVTSGLVPAIHVFHYLRDIKTWMPGTRPGMTVIQMPAQPQPFTLAVSDAAIADLRERLARTRFPHPAPGPPRVYGSDVAHIQGPLPHTRAGAPTGSART